MPCLYVEYLIRQWNSCSHGFMFGYEGFMRFSLNLGDSGLHGSKPTSFFGTWSYGGNNANHMALDRIEETLRIVKGIIPMWLTSNVCMAC